MCDVLRLVLVCGLAPFVKGAALRPPFTTNSPLPPLPFSTSLASFNIYSLIVRALRSASVSLVAASADFCLYKARRDT